MDVVKLQIPLEFVARRARIGWQEIGFGIEHELLEPSAPVAHAASEVARQETPSGTLTDLAESSRSESTSRLVQLLAASEPRLSEDAIRRKWLFIVLAWLYERRAEIEDPLGVVELVYADFGYPEEIASFVRYMPMVGRDLGSVRANEDRLLNRWKEFVECEERKYAPSQ